MVIIISVCHKRVANCPMELMLKIKGIGWGKQKEDGGWRVRDGIGRGKT